jgi:hypothetical protein
MKYNNEYIATTLNEYFNNVKDLSRYEKYKKLKENQPIIVYRGIHESGKNFYQGDEPLPFTYYALTKEKAQEYGNVNIFIFNFDSLPIKIFKGHELFDKFGLNSDIENEEVIDTLISEGYSAVLLKGDELVVYDKSLIKNI